MGNCAAFWSFEFKLYVLINTKEGEGRMKRYCLLMLVLCLSALFMLPVYADAQDLQGDINSDGIVSADDALMVLKHVADLDEIPEVYINRADVNQDKRVTAKDALNILKYAVGIIESFDEIIVELEQGVIYPHAKYNVVAAEVKVAEEETVIVISSYEEYENLLNQYGENLSDNSYSKEFFEENTLLCAVHRFPTGDFFDMTLEKIILSEDNVNLYLNAFGPIVQSEVEAYWTMFIPVEGKEWSNYSYTINVTDYVNSYLCSGVGAEHASTFRTENIVGQKDITILSTYEEYLDYYKKYNNNIVEPETWCHNHALLGCEKEFFEENSIIVASYTEISGSIDIKCSSLVEKDGEWLIYIDREIPDVITDDMAQWEIMIPVEGKDWAYKNISIAESEDNVVNMDYSKVQVISAYCGDHNEDYIPRIRLISTYADYEAYAEKLKEKLDVHYGEAYFENNILIVVDLTKGDYDTEVYFKNIEYLENESVYQINIESVSSVAQSPMPRPWEIIIPFEGKSWKIENFKVINTGVMEGIGWALQSSKANPVEGYNKMDYPLVLDSYEEYKEYIELFKKANPGYELKKEYTEARFEDLDIEYVVGGFWTASGQMDLKYVNSTLTDGKININFEGRCPSEHTDDTYYYHYMIEMGFVRSSDREINLNVNVEYY